MLLVSEQDFNEFQKASISEFFQGFLNELDSVPYSEIELDKPREYVFYLIKMSLIGRLEYAMLYSLAEKVMLNKKNLYFFGVPHTKSEIKDFVLKLN